MIYDLLNEKEKELTKRIILKKDEILFHENDTCKEIGIVTKGVISISSFTFQGKEIIYNTITKGGIFGNNLLFSSEPTYKGNIISKVDSEIILIDKLSLLKIFETNQEFLKEYLHIQSDFGKSLNNKIKVLSFYKGEDRFFYYLASHNNSVRFHSINELANELNMSREATSRMVNKLKNEGKIFIRNNQIILIE